MERTPEDLIAAIKQIRDYASSYKGKRQAFYDDLYAMLATPIPEDGNVNTIVKKMYIAAIGALTSEIQPPTAETYDSVLKRLNSVLSEEQLGPVNIAIYPDEGIGDVYGIVGEVRTGDLSTPRTERLKDVLPRRRKLTQVNQALVDKFRAEIPRVERPFEYRGARRG